MKLKTNLIIVAVLLIGLSCNSSKKSSETKSTPAVVFENVKWDLVEVMGKPVADYGNQMNKPGFFFDGNAKRFYGNAGCNNMGGAYEFIEGNRIRFSEVMTTMMACPNLELEDVVGKMFPTLDTYYISDQGDLIFTKARMAPVLRFVKAEGK